MKTNNTFKIDGAKSYYATPAIKRGLSRSEAASYIGISASLFDELVKDGEMPKSLPIRGRRLWDIRRLDEAFDALAMNEQTLGTV